MDIVVTLPKGEELAKSQYRGGEVIFWAISKKPKDLKVYDRVYFVDGDSITYYHLFIGFAQDPMCDLTGRVYAGLILILYPKRRPLAMPIKYDGFQGFRYKEKE